MNDFLELYVRRRTESDGMDVNVVSVLVEIVGDEFWRRR